MYNWFVKVRRVAWIPFLAAALAGILSYSMVSNEDTRYRADLLLVVPATSPSTGAVGPDGATSLLPTSTTRPDILGRPSEAQRLASTYAELLPNDVRTLEAVAAAVGRPLSDVQTKVQAVAVPDSSLVRVTYTSDSSEETAAALEALQRSVATDEPVSPAVAPESLVFVSVEEPFRVSSGERVAVLSAMLVGIVFGLFVAVGWGRSDPRAYSADEVGAVLDVPIFDLDESDPERVGQVFRAIGLRTSHPGAGPATLVVMAASKRGQAAAREVTSLLAAVSNVGPSGARDVRAVYGGVATGGPTPSAFVEGDGVLLVAVRGERLRVLMQALDGIRRLGGSVAGSVLVTGTRRRDSSTSTSEPASMFSSTVRSAIVGIAPNAESKS